MPFEARRSAGGGRGDGNGVTDALPSLNRARARALSHGMEYAYDRAKQAMMLESDRPIALRDAIMACRNGGTVSVIGVYTGFIDKFPMGSVMNRSLTIKSGQAHVQRYMKPLFERIEKGELDPTFIITHRLPLADAARGYAVFNDKADDCMKVVLKAA